MSGVLDCVLPVALRPYLRFLSGCESVLVFLTRRVRLVRTPHLRKPISFGSWGLNDSRQACVRKLMRGLRLGVMELSSCTVMCAREKETERVCASVRLRVRMLSKYSVRLAHVPRLARLVTSRANKSHLITTEC